MRAANLTPEAEQRYLALGVRVLPESEEASFYLARMRDDERARVRREGQAFWVAFAAMLILGAFLLLDGGAL